jgi:hypothetical protein
VEIFSASVYGTPSYLSEAEVTVDYLESSMFLSVAVYKF